MAMSTFKFFDFVFKKNQMPSITGDRVRQKGDIKQAVCSLDPIHNLKRSRMHLVKND